MQKIKAIVLSGKGSVPELQEIPMPEPGPGEVLVKIHASPINPSDLAFIEGKYGLRKKYPVVPGFEGSGTVVKAGKGFLPKLWKGKRVACAASPKLNGCWAEYMVTQANMCVPISKKVDLDEAAMLFVNPMTALAFFDVYKKLPNPSGKKRAIINTAAASALGRMVIRLGKKYNVPVISIVRREEQVKLLQDDGADNILNSNDPDFTGSLKVLSKKLNASVIFDAVGGNMIQQLLSAVPPGSDLFVYGRLSEDNCEILPGDLIFSGNRIHGFWLSGYLKDKSFIQSVKATRTIQSLIGNELKTEVQAEFSIDRFNEALDTYTKNMSRGKVLLKF